MGDDGYMQSFVNHAQQRDPLLAITSAHVFEGERGFQCHLGEALETDPPFAKIARTLDFVELEQHDYIVITIKLIQIGDGHDDDATVEGERQSGVRKRGVKPLLP
jgi:hypothetical protein